MSLRRNKILSNINKAFLIICVFLIGSLSMLDAPGVPGGLEATAESFYKELSECTTGLASGLVTPDGRPLLWKTRDVGSPNQEYHYVDDGRIPFVGLTYRNEDTWQYYGGINAVGFAVENSNCYNLGPRANANGWGASDDDGEIHMLALATCRTVDDFQVILDSLDVAEGRTLNSNYGTFDAFGGAAMFETEGFTYTRYDAAETEEGFIVRSNYGYSGDLNDRPTYWGPNRHDRAYALWKHAVEQNILTPRYLYQEVVRCLHPEGIEEFEVPYNGFYQDNPFGLIPNGETICRSSSQSIMIAQGVREGERPDNGLIWGMPGNPIGCITTPLWVRAGSVPVEHDGINGSRICDVSLNIRDWVVENGGFGSAVNTWKLKNPEGTGYWDWSFQLENLVFERVERFRNSPQFAFDRLEAFQNLLARQVADSIENWKPSFNAQELAEPIFWENNVVLAWEPAEEDVLGRDIEPQGYHVYRSDQPFRQWHRGDLVGTVREETFMDENPLSGGAYYRVEVVY